MTLLASGFFRKLRALGAEGQFITNASFQRSFAVVVSAHVKTNYFD